MQRLMEQSQWMLENRTISKVGRGGILLAVLILVACAGTNTESAAGSMTGVLHPSVNDILCPASSEPANCALIHNFLIHEQSVPTGAFPEEDELPSLAALPPNGEATVALTCLALNVYWEARNQPVAGQLAVAQVTLNRVRDPRYGNNVCDVVHEHRQFSWYWDGKSDAPKENNAWQTAYLVASAALDGSGHVELQGVTHYHAVYIQPYWKDQMVRVAMIGDHAFYAD